MKKVSLVAVIILLAGMFFTSCEKQEIMENNQQDLSQTDPTLQKILNFKNTVENPTKAGSETMSIDSAVWYIEALLNFEYCIVKDASEIYPESAMDSVIIELTDEEISLYDVISNYLTLKDYVNSSLKELDYKYKRLNIADVTFKDGKLITFLVYNFGETNKKEKSLPIYGDWHWGGIWQGNNLIPQGNCDWEYVGKKDASTEIGRAIRYDIPIPYNYTVTNVGNITKWWNPSDPDWSLFVRDDNPYPIWRDPNAGGNPVQNNSCFWFGVANYNPSPYYPCIEQTELNWYKEATLDAINIIKDELIPSGKTYKEFYFRGDNALTQYQTTYQHKLTVFYGDAIYYIHH